MQPRVYAYALIKHKAFAVVMGAAAVLKVLKNAAFQLQHVLKALRLHVGAGLLTAYTPGAEHHDGLLFKFFGKLCDGGREVAEMIHAGRPCVLKGAQLHFVVIARIEQGDRPAFIQPSLQLLRRQLG